MKIGTYVKIVRDPLVPLLNGMAGQIVAIEQWEGETLYRVVAENYGPFMRTPRNGEKPVRAWIRGNWRRVPAHALEELPIDEPSATTEAMTYGPAAHVPAPQPGQLSPAQQSAASRASQPPPLAI